MVQRFAPTPTPILSPMARGSWGKSKQLTTKSWGIVKENRYLLAFPVLGFVGSLIPLAIFWIPAAWFYAHDNYVPGTIAAIVGIFATQIVISITSGGLVASADEELAGRDASVGHGIGASLARIVPLIGWAFIQTVVNVIVSLIRGNNQSGAASVVRNIAASGILAMWSLITFFVVPFIMLDRVGPITAIKESSKLFKAKWGLQIFGGVRIGGIVALITILPAILRHHPRCLPHPVESLGDRCSAHRDRRHRLHHRCAADCDLAWHLLRGAVPVRQGRRTRGWLHRGGTRRGGAHEGVTEPSSSANTLRRIGLLGAESTGKTTLAFALASSIDAFIAEEYLRDFVRDFARLPTLADQEGIFLTQQATVATVARAATHATVPWVIADPLPLMTAVYSIVYFDDDSPHRTGHRRRERLRPSAVVRAGFRC